jgi:hypothetical protein
MSDALIFGAVFLVLVLATQIGRRRHTVLLAVMPFFTSTTIGVLAIATGQHHYQPADIGLGLAGAAIGVLAGCGLNRCMAVWRDPATNRLYTRAGAAYLGIWLAVLLGRTAFVAALEYSHPFEAWFGGVLESTGTTPDGVSAFFLLMALVMVITRETGVLLRARTAPAADPRPRELSLHR